ncbi:MAG: glycoside hydrolase family 3 C-terminal domain-containing protein [Bacteroidales bacterium]|nr:glycoside hydrolase family 3 C-terminal domain-containing protein [Bacteroidales bacterium]
MRLTLFLSIALMLIQGLATAQTHDKPTGLSYEAADLKADSVLRLMTLEEKLSYIGGYRIFYTREIERLGIPSLAFVDATQGVRINPAILNKGWKKPAKKTVAYPAPILLASTWNRNLCFQYAHSIGEECRAANFPILLGPGFNIYRNSQCGRNFEYFGEDPYLIAEMISEYVTGLQATGTIATLKHFVANNTDYYRRKSNTLVDERSLHEIYLPGFRAGIDAGAKAVMTSYNLVNGEWAGQSDYVINQLLRKELGYKWMVMTDWISVWDGEKTIKSGQDLEMPFSKATKNADKLLEEGVIEEADIDRMVKSILRSFIAMGSFEGEKQPLNKADYDRLEEIALNTARQGIVMLRNDKGLLPIDKSADQEILVTGFFLDKRIGGGGAANVKGYDNISLKDALIDEFGHQLSFVRDPTEKQLQEADIVILSVGTRDKEAVDRPFDLPEDQEKQLQFCTQNNANTIVLVTSGGGINMSRWEKAGTIIYTWYMGQNGAIAAAEILSGKTNPSGKLPITIEKQFEDSPAYGYIPEGEKLYANFKMSVENKRLVYDLRYREGIFVGYRWYEFKDIKPLFCFGHGLSYTSFEYTGLRLSKTQLSKDEPLEVKFMLHNSGERDGAEIVQLYITDKKCSLQRPVKELKGFERVFLKQGESKEVTLQLDPQEFAFWDPQTKGWKVESGSFEIRVGASSEDIRLQETVEVE